MLNSKVQKPIEPDKFTLDDLYRCHDEAMAWQPQQQQATGGSLDMDVIKQRVLQGINGKNSTGNTKQTI